MIDYLISPYCSLRHCLFKARTLAVPAQSIATPQSEEEASVYYIVAIPYDLFRNARASAVGDVELYFPAYDVQKELVNMFWFSIRGDR